MASPHSSPFVLLVEDDSDCRELYSTVLALAGYSVADVANAEHAFRRATTMRPAVIITDVLLGDGLDGIQLCERLKSDQRTREIPVIVVTAWAHPQMSARAERAGCISVHMKPITPEALVNIVNGAVQRGGQPANSVTGQ